MRLRAGNESKGRSFNWDLTFCSSRKELQHVGHCLYFNVLHMRYRPLCNYYLDFSIPNDLLCDKPPDSVRPTAVPQSGAPSSGGARRSLLLHEDVHRRVSKLIGHYERNQSHNKSMCSRDVLKLHEVISLDYFHVVPCCLMALIGNQFFLQRPYAE